MHSIYWLPMQRNGWWRLVKWVSLIQKKSISDLVHNLNQTNHPSNLKSSLSINSTGLDVDMAKSSLYFIQTTPLPHSSLAQDQSALFCPFSKVCFLSVSVFSNCAAARNVFLSWTLAASALGLGEKVRDPIYWIISYLDNCIPM